MTTAIDLNKLAPPGIVEELSFSAIRDAMMADLQSRDVAYTAIVPSDPAYKLNEGGAYRETLVRQRVNDAARAVMLATATGVDLDNLVALFNLERLTVDPGDPAAVPPVLPTYESDDALRQRALLAMEALSVAGPSGAYEFHAKTASGLVKDVYVTSPTPGAITVSILSTEAYGDASPSLLTAVRDVVNNRGVRPLTDNVTVQSAAIVHYSISATLTYYSGPSAAEVLAAAQASAQAYADAQHKIGRDITLSGVYAALHVAGVQRVTLTNPSADIVISSSQAAYCNSVTITDGGLGE